MLKPSSNTEIHVQKTISDMISSTIMEMINHPHFKHFNTPEMMVVQPLDALRCVLRIQDWRQPCRGIEGACFIFIFRMLCGFMCGYVISMIYILLYNI